MRFDPSKTYSSFVGKKKFPEFEFCSFQHDKDYVELKVSRREADRAFRYCMEKVCADCTDPKRARQLRMAMRQRHFFVRSLGWLMWYT